MDGYGLHCIYRRLLLRTALNYSTRTPWWNDIHHYSYMYLGIIQPERNPGQNISATLAEILYVSVLLGTAIDIRQFDHLMDTQLTLALMLSVWTCDSAACLF